jgi:hypothetical protein
LLSSEHHSFDVYLAAEYGIQEAIMIHHFQHWIGVNMRKKNGKKQNFRNGKWWTYDTIDNIAAHFPYWSKDQVVTIIERLCKGKSRFEKTKKFEPVLIKGNFNKVKYDRTLWYAFANEEKFIKLRNNNSDIVETHNRNCSPTPPIPDTKPDTKTNTCFVSAKADAEKASQKEKNFDLESIKAICKSKYPKASKAEIDYAIEQLVNAVKVSNPTKYVLAVLAKQFSSKANKRANSLYEKCKDFFAGLKKIESSYNTFIPKIEFKQLIFQASDAKREFSFEDNNFRESVHFFLNRYDYELASRFRDAFLGNDYNASNFMRKQGINPMLLK